MGKKMKKAPVYFTIVQVRHDQIMQLATYAPAIQEQMRLSGYPDYKRGGVVELSLNQQIEDELQAQPPMMQQAERFMFTNIESTKGFILDQNALSFQTTSYESFEKFAEEFMVGLGIVHTYLKLQFTDRIGLRFLDAVVPPAGTTHLNNYLVPGVLGLYGHLPSDSEVVVSISQSHIQAPGCAVIARTIIQKGPLGFPMDLQALGFQVGKQFQKIEGLHAIIDTDAWSEGKAIFDLTGIRSRLEILRHGVGVAFEATVTPEAIEDWTKE